MSPRVVLGLALVIASGCDHASAQAPLASTTARRTQRTETGAASTGDPRRDPPADRDQSGDPDRGGDMGEKNGPAEVIERVRDLSPYAPDEAGLTALFTAVVA